MDTFALPPIKCLLVDDLEENLLALSALLARHDVNVLTARSGSEALELLLVHEVALAFLDVQMPDMDGFELAELLRGSERTRHIPLIYVTAGAREQHRQFKGYESGAVDFIYKPIEPHIIKNKADVFFQLYRQRQLLALELNDRTETLRLNEMFTALLAHDLRSPLSAILASAHLLQRRSSDPAALEAAARVVTSGNRMASMIEDMLDLARARLGGGIPVKREATDCKALVERVLREHQAAAPDAVQLDGTRADSVVLIVKNAGTIPPDILPHLFDPFRGGQRQPGRGDGLGLGLYIVSQSCKRTTGPSKSKQA